MFKIPDWGEDVPKSNANFAKRSKKTKMKNNQTPVNTVQNQFQASDKVATANPFTVKTKKKRKKNKKAQPGMKPSLNLNGDSNQPGRFVLNPFKKTINADNNINVNKKQKSNQKHNVEIKSNGNENVKISENDNLQSVKNDNKLFNNNQNNEPKTKKKKTRLKTKLKSNENTGTRIKQSVEKNLIAVNNDNKKVSRKRKIKSCETNKLLESDNSFEITNLYTDTPDEALLDAKKKKIDKILKNEDREDILFSEKQPKITKSAGTNINTFNNVNNSKNTNLPTSNVKNKKIDIKKEKLRKILEVQNVRNPIKTTGNKLRERMMEKLKAAQFRYLNEKLYTSSGSDAQQLFHSDPVAFQTYHQGYQQQLKKWPINPLDVIVKKILKMPKSHTIADMGCGEGALARRVPHKVRSFDLVASGAGIEACDIARTPLLSASVDAAVYCLALMGTELTRYLVEANRVLKDGGQLLIAEVESRFDDIDAFTRDVQRLGFKLKKLDKSHQVFVFLDFTKTREPPVKKSKLPTLTLKPCIYKRR